MQQAKRIESIGISKLIAHPANPNRMSGSAFSKLAAHIERTGNYEPVIVRPHQQRTGCYEIINGHHRVRALRKLGSETCDCVIWQVDDAETLVLLATLNRLSGHDVLEKKAELIKDLSERFSTKDLAKKLPDTKRAIERLKNLYKPPRPAVSGHKAFLNPQVFFLTDEQKQTVAKAIAVAAPTEGAETAAQKRARAIVKIARTFLRVNLQEENDYEA
jgi:ParB/RepB/Spo0J family partition protein